MLSQQLKTTNARCDLGAQIVTGFHAGNPLDVIVNNQLKLPVHFIEKAQECPIYDKNGTLVHPLRDKVAEETFNSVLSNACCTIFEPESNTFRVVQPRIRTDKVEPLPSLGEMIAHYHAEAAQGSSTLLDPQTIQLFHWHQANLEYGNAAYLNHLSLHHWDMDDGHEFSGNHSMIKGGMAQIPELIAQRGQFNIEFNCAVESIKNQGKIKVKCRNGRTFDGDACVVSVSLGVLKSKDIEFTPMLPDQKQASIDRMGFGFFNKVVLLFPSGKLFVLKSILGHFFGPFWITWT